MRSNLLDLFLWASLLSQFLSLDRPLVDTEREANYKLVPTDRQIYVRPIRRLNTIARGKIWLSRETSAVVCRAQTETWRRVHA